MTTCCGGCAIDTKKEAQWLLMRGEGFKRAVFYYC